MKYFLTFDELLEKKNIDNQEDIRPIKKSKKKLFKKQTDEEQQVIVPKIAQSVKDEPEYNSKAIKLIQKSVANGVVRGQEMEDILKAVHPNKAWFRMPKNRSFRSAFKDYLIGAKYVIDKDAIIAWNMKKNEVKKG